MKHKVRELDLHGVPHAEVEMFLEKSGGACPFVVCRFVVSVIPVSMIKKMKLYAIAHAAKMNEE